MALGLQGPTGLVSGSQYWLCDKQNWSALYTGATDAPPDPAQAEQFAQAREKYMSAMTTPDTELRDHVFEQCGKAFGAKQFQAVCKAGSVLFIHFVSCPLCPRVSALLISTHKGCHGA